MQQQPNGRSRRKTVGDHQPDSTSKLGYCEDEIDLFELLMVLWRQRLIVLSIFLISLFGTTIYSFTATPLFKISAQLQSGITDFRASEGSDSALGTEPIRGVDTQVLKSYFTQPNVWYEAQAIPANIPHPEIRVKIPRRSSIVEVYFYWPKPKKGVSLLSDLIGKMKDPGGENLLSTDLDFGRKRIKMTLLEAIEEENSLKVEQKRLTNTIESRKKRVQELEREVELIRKNIFTVENGRNELAKQIEEVKEKLGYHPELASKGNHRNKKKSNYTKISVPIQQYPLILANIQSRLMDLEEKVSDYKLRVLDFRRREIDRLKGEIQDLERYRDGDLQRNLLSAKKRIDLLKSQLSMLSIVDIVVPPHASQSPVKPKKKLLWALGGVLGLFLGVFAAFMTEFWLRNREKFTKYSHDKVE